METILPYLVLGCVSGLMSGLFGIGGGAIIVPMLVFMFTLQGVAEAVMMQLAVGSSLAVIVITALSSIRAHARYGNIGWRRVAHLTPGIVGGALLGAVLAAYMSFSALRTVFAVFLLAVAAQMVLRLSPSRTVPMPGAGGLLGAGGVIGLLSALVGIGGGAMTVPLLARYGMEMRRAVGTSAACGLPIALAGMLGYLVMGMGRDGLPEWSTGFVYWPAVFWVALAGILLAPVGARLAQTMPQAVLRGTFAAFLVSVALGLLLR